MRDSRRGRKLQRPSLRGPGWRGARIAGRSLPTSPAETAVHRSGEGLRNRDLVLPACLPSRTVLFPLVSASVPGGPAAGSPEAPLPTADLGPSQPRHHRGLSLTGDPFIYHPPGSVLWRPHDAHIDFHTHAQFCLCSPCSEVVSFLQPGPCLWRPPQHPLWPGEGPDHSPPLFPRHWHKGSSQDGRVMPEMK